jgi:hypothetical protein
MHGHNQLEPAVRRYRQARVGDPALRVHDIGARIVNDGPKSRHYSRIRYRRMEWNIGPHVPIGQELAGPASDSADVDPIDSFFIRRAGQACRRDRHLVTTRRESPRERLDMLLHAAYERFVQVGDLQDSQWSAHMITGLRI